MNSYVAWPNDESGQRFNVSLIEQSASQDGSSMVLSVYDKDQDKILKGAEIVLNQDGEDSFIKISADNIVMDGTTTFVKPSDLGTSGETVIDGARIQTGTIDAKRIDADNLKVKAANITGELVVADDSSTLFTANLTNNSVEIAGWKAYKGSLYSGSDFTNSTCFLCSNTNGTSTKMVIGGSSNISGWVLKAGDYFGVTYEGKLYAEEAEIRGKIISGSGQIGGINLSENALSVGQTLESASEFKANISYTSSTKKANITFVNTGWDNYVYDISGKSSVYVSQWTSGLVELFILDHIPTANETATVYSYHKCVSGDGVYYQLTNPRGAEPAYLVINASPYVVAPIATTKPGGFVISSDGSITCSNATLTGKIIASSGQIGGLNITSNGLTKSAYGLNGYSEYTTQTVKIQPGLIEVSEAMSGRERRVALNAGLLEISRTGTGYDQWGHLFMKVSLGSGPYWLYIDESTGNVKAVKMADEG